jgi:GxxExxY protein
MVKIIEKELSYKLVGLLFDIHNKLGGEYQEKYYTRAVEEKLKEADLRYKKELPVDLKIDGKKIGKYILDFLVENKIVLEIKAKPEILPVDVRQVLAYLQSMNLELGIIANFRGRKLIYKRILNPKAKNSD